MIHFFKENPEWVAIFLYSLWEHWIGHTKKIKANSTLGLIGSILTSRIVAESNKFSSNKVDPDQKQKQEETMKSVQIMKEEIQKAFPGVAEEVIEKGVAVIFEKALPRIAVEEDNAIVKSVAGVAVMAYPAIKPSLEKLTDLDHDGK